MPSSLARLWRHAQSAITALCAQLFPLDTLLAGERRQLRGWLRALEAFCRRLALTEALALARETARAPTPIKLSTHTHALRPRPALRLWPRFKRTAPRMRLLGPATSVREIEAERRRSALAARLAAARRRPKPAHLRIADRIEALQRFLDAPFAAIRRFARKLRTTPGIAALIVAARAPLCPFLSPDCVNECEALSYAAALNSS